MEADARARTREMATMGLFARQMAHDLRNPLAALKGAIEWIQHDPSSKSLSPQTREFLDLSVTQAKRMETQIQRYQRLGQVAPERSVVNLESMPREMVALQGAVTSRVTCTVDVEPAVASWDLDSDLVGASVDNLLRNALEAMPEGGTLKVSAGQAERLGQRGLQLTVTDTGKGMDARTRESAFDDFFTTKDMGQGLGLSFVRRVAMAHGGHTWIENNLPRGTRVSMWFPTQAES
jgi:two-component system sensor histidine kinase HydH